MKQYCMWQCKDGKKFTQILSFLRSSKMFFKIKLNVCKIMVISFRPIFLSSYRPRPVIYKATFTIFYNFILFILTLNSVRGFTVICNSNQAKRILFLYIIHVPTLQTCASLHTCMTVIC